MSKTTDLSPDDLTAPAEAIEKYLDDYVRSLPLPGNLIEAVAYSLLGGGKRMRPILAIRGAQAVGGTAEQAMPAAGAIELIHCFSLVHDDLPAMDDDDLRRGRPTLHKHAGEAMAILAGDLMMGAAFDLLATRLEPTELANAVIRELTTGTNLMIAGQVYDTLGGFAESQTDPAQRLETIHSHKTGALLRASVRMGAICAKADAAQLETLTRYGDAIGLMFQVVDDVLDVTATTEQLGKTAGKDVAQDKMTYPAIHGIDRSRELIKQLQQDAHAALEPLGPSADHLRQLCDFLAVRTN